LVNNSIAIDAGCLGFHGTPAEQARIRHVFLTHTHIDHIATLPIFLDMAFSTTGAGVNVYGTAPVLDCLRRDIFNDRVWPDLVRLSETRAAYLTLHTLTPGRSVRVDGLELTSVAVDHAVPTVGYVIDDGKATIVITSDTGPTEAIWKRARAAKNCKAVFLEATFPDSMSWLAELAKHLTPASFAVEARKGPPGGRFICRRLHSRYHRQVAKELAALS